MSYRTFARILSRSIVTYRRPLIGPVDPISNLRPSLYGPPRDVTRNPGHPYSPEEFTVANGYSEEDEGEDMLWRLQQEQLEQFTREFWTDNNLGFQAARQAVLDALPPPAPSASSDETAAHEREVEQALSAFYADWLKEESPRHRAFTREWNQRNYASLISTCKKHWRDWIRSLRSVRPVEK